MNCLKKNWHFPSEAFLTHRYILKDMLLPLFTARTVYTWVTGKRGYSFREQFTIDFNLW